MSSAGWARARVATAAALAEKDRLAAHAEVEGAMAHRRVLRDAARQASADWGVDLGAPVDIASTGSDPASLRARAAAIRAANDELENELVGRTRVERVRRAGDTLSALRAQHRAAAVEAERIEHPEQPSMRDAVTELLDAAAAEGLDIESLAPLAEAALATSGEAVDLAMAHLRSRVARQRKDRVRDAAQAVALAEQGAELSRLSGLLVAAAASASAPIVLEVAAATRRVASGDLLGTDDLAGLVAGAEAELRRAEKQIEQSELARNLREVLQELDYEPVTGMATAVVEGGRVVTRSEWVGTHVFSAEADAAGDIAFETIRVKNGADADAEAVADRAVENDVCAVLPEVFERLRARGIETYDARVVPPGAMRMKRRTTDAAKTTGRARLAHRAAEAG